MKILRLAFVANFIGESNFIDGKLMKVDKGFAQMQNGVLASWPCG